MFGCARQRAVELIIETGSSCRFSFQVVMRLAKVTDLFLVMFTGSCRH
jgi:hypothetical protein